MPRPHIIMPETVKVGRDGQVRVRQKGWSVVGKVLPHDEGGGRWWAAYKSDGTPLCNGTGDKPLMFGGQREAAKCLCQHAGLWPEEG